MNATLTPLHKAKGSVLVLTALSLFVIMAVAGLAIDLSHSEVNKTRLQNLADALALSAAISLNKQNDLTTNVDEIAAEAYARTQTLDLFKKRPGNDEIKDAIASGLDFEFTFANITDLNKSEAGDWKTANAINDANFVRVTSLNTPMNISTWFAGIGFPGIAAGFPLMAVSTSAVAGFAPIVPCDVAPVMMCADVDSSGNIKDPDCDDDTNAKSIPGVDKDCYGYEINALYCMKQQEGAWSDDPLCPQPPTGSYGAGNFGFLDFDPPGLNPSLKYCTAGDPNCALNCRFDTDPTSGLPIVPTKTGQNFGPVSDGFNTRFNLYGAGLTANNYPPDLVIGSGTNGDVSKVQRIGSETEVTNIYTVYSTAATDITTNVSLGRKGRRILPIPFVDCRASIDGKTDVKILGFGCFMMAREYGNSTQPYVYSGDQHSAIDPNKKFLYGVFVGDDVCNGAGKTSSISDFGYDKVILYKDPFGGHS